VTETRSNRDATASSGAAQGWSAVDADALGAMLRSLTGPAASALVLVDGRSGSGKTTFAGRAAAALDAAVVHTDDLAWHHDPTAWTDLLIDGVLAPWRRGAAVHYRPPAWDRLGRTGSIRVLEGRPALVVEGVGVGRAELARLADLVVWVRSDPREARRRGVARDVELGRTPAAAEAFWDEWARAEDPFLEHEQPWRTARLVVDGTPPRGIPDGLVRVAPGPWERDG